MIRILILIVVVILTTLLGILLTANKKKRMRVYAELYEFNEQLILSMKFGQATLKKLAEPFKFIPEILNGKHPLTGNDDEVIGDYFMSLGKTDALSQIDYLTERKTLLKKYKEESAAEYKKYSSLYTKIFFLIGVLIAVMLA